MRSFSSSSPSRPTSQPTPPRNARARSMRRWNSVTASHACGAVFRQTRPASPGLRSVMRGRKTALGHLLHIKQVPHPISDGARAAVAAPERLQRDRATPRPAGAGIGTRSWSTDAGYRTESLFVEGHEARGRWHQAMAAAIGYGRSSQILAIRSRPRRSGAGRAAGLAE